MKDVTVELKRLEGFLALLAEKADPASKSEVNQAITHFLNEIKLEQRLDLKYDDLIREIESFCVDYLKTDLEIRMNKLPHGSWAELVVSDPDSTDYKTLVEVENPDQSDLQWLDEIKEKLQQQFD